MFEELYLCDPNKNTNCKKTICYENNRYPQYGECKYTRDKKFSKDGKVYFYNEKTMKIELYKN